MLLSDSCNPCYATDDIDTTITCMGSTFGMHSVISFKGNVLIIRPLNGDVHGSAFGKQNLLWKVYIISFHFFVNSVAI